MEFHPCGTCSVHVLETDEAVQCDGQCSLWHHRECLGMTLAEYLKLSRGQEDWFCRKCLVKQEIKQEAQAERRRRQKSEMGKTKIECKKLDVLTGTQECVFCHRRDIDEMKYGPIYMHKNIITHYYCLLLSSNMEQNGRDSDGILGFLSNDIHKEVKRGVRLFCSFCRSGGATLGCAISKCKVVFHLPCGMKHGTLHQFFGEFKSYCAKHRPVQRISAKILSESSKNAMCGICYEKVVPRPIHETLWAPCCQKSAFFHRDCVQKLATSAGYFFKCPLCNNTSVFQKEMKEYGIYIPEQDASWECVPNAYQDLLVRHDMCDSASCGCPTGRKTNNQGTRWELILCKYCGSQGMHIGCGRLKWKCPEFVCDTCSGNNLATESQEANSRNYHGNRHRLSGSGRAAEIHPSVSADREGERSESDSNDSSDESTKLTLTIRGGRRRVISSPAKVASPPPVIPTKTHNKDGKKPDPAEDTVTVVIDDSDDDVEVVSETKGSGCLKTNDGATIPVVQVKDSVKKRLNVEGDVNVVPDEIVDITTQVQGPPKKKAPSPHVQEVIYENPFLTPNPSTSTTFSCPSTSFTTPPDGTKFVLVDPATFRPEDIPPGTVLFRSLAPTNTPQPTLLPQPQVQQIPTSQVPIPQLGGSSGSSADAKHPDICEYGSRSSFNFNPPTRHTKETSRSNKHNSFGRRGRGRCDNDRRLNPRVLVSPLKCRISNNGFFEILLPRRNLGSSFGFGAFKRKISPLPSRPAKKIKMSSNGSDVKKRKKSLKRSMPNKTKNQGNKRSSKTKTERKKENIKPNDCKDNNNAQKYIPIQNVSTQITMFFPPEKPNLKKKEKKSSHESNVNHNKGKKTLSDQKNKQSISTPNSKANQSKKTHGEGKDKTSPEEEPVARKKHTQKIKCPLMEWKYKKIDEYLSKFNRKLVTQAETYQENNKMLNVENENGEVVKILLDELIGYVVGKYLSSEDPITSSEMNHASSLDISNETNSNEENNSFFTVSISPSVSNNVSGGSSVDIYSETVSIKEDNPLTITDSSNTLVKEQVVEEDCGDIKCNLPNFEVMSESSNLEKKVTKTSNEIMNMETGYPLSVSSRVEVFGDDYDADDDDVCCEVNQVKEAMQRSEDCKTSISISNQDHDHDDKSSVGGHTKEIDHAYKEGCVNVNEVDGSVLCSSLLSDKEEELVNFGGKENELQIPSNLNENNSAIRDHRFFTRVKFKASAKVKSCAYSKHKAKSFLVVKLKGEPEPRKNVKTMQFPTTTKRKIEHVNSGSHVKMNERVTAGLKSKGNVKDLDPSKTKRRKIEKKVSPVSRTGGIKNYFSPINKDYFCTSTNPLGNVIPENNEKHENEKKDAFLPPSAEDEDKIFWKTLNSLNSPEKEKKTALCPSTTQNSSEKTPLVELKFNNIENTNAVKAIQF